MPAGDMIDVILGRRRTKRKRGFTLLELLGVVALIGALTAGGIVAIKPREQFRTVWDARRVKDVANLERALQQYAFADPLGRYPNNDAIPASEAASVAICKQGVENGTDGCVNLDALVGRYLPAIPSDEVEPCSAISGYRVYRKLNERFPAILATHMHKLPGDSVTLNCQSDPTAPGSGVNYDFNFSNNLTYPGYIGVLHSDIYVAQRNYGWNAATATVDRGAAAPNALLRDLHFQSNQRTFSVEVANGEYFVTLIIGDWSRHHDRIEISLEGVYQPPEVAFLTGQFTTQTFPVTVADGVLTVQLRDLGGTDPNWVINGLIIRAASAMGNIRFDTKAPMEADGLTIDTYTGTTAGLADGTLLTLTTTLGTITSADASSLYNGHQVSVTNNTFTVQIRRPSGIGPTTFGTISVMELEGRAMGTVQQKYKVAVTRRFDFNRTTSPSETGFLGVRSANTYTSTLGFGWTSGPIQILEKDTGVPTSLRRDMHYQSNPQTFHIQVKPGVAYNIRTYMGDTQTYHDYMDVVGEGQALFTVTSLPAGTFDVHTFTLTSADDDMQITFSQTGGLDPSWIINGIDISEQTLPAEMP